jgi:uncharacterized membrane protein
MQNLSDIGRNFFGIALGGVGVLTIYYDNFGYMLIPTRHLQIPGVGMSAYISGAWFILSGVFIVFRKKIRLISLLLGSVLLLIFCFYLIPYQFMFNPNYMSFGEWENAEKVLTLSGGAFIIAGCFSMKNENSFTRLLAKLIPLGVIFFSLTIICYGINHFLYAKDTADYIPVWMPFKLFWTYFAGTALIGSGIAIILKIKPRLIATLLGTMIFIWFIILHIPRIIVSPAEFIGGEFLGAFLALAYCGIAFVIAGTKHN